MVGADKDTQIVLRYQDHPATKPDPVAIMIQHLPPTETVFGKCIRLSTRISMSCSLACQQRFRGLRLQDLHAIELTTVEQSLHKLPHVFSGGHHSDARRGTYIIQGHNLVSATLIEIACCQIGSDLIR